MCCGVKNLFQSHKTRLKLGGIAGLRSSSSLFQSHKTRLKHPAFTKSVAESLGFQSHKTRLKHLLLFSFDFIQAFISISQDPIKTATVVNGLYRLQIFQSHKTRLKHSLPVPEVVGGKRFQSHKTRLKQIRFEVSESDFARFQSHKTRLKPPTGADAHGMRLISISQDPIKTRAVRIPSPRCKMYFNLTRPD